MNDRDIRINLFLGLANWFIFLDHIPNNVVNWLTARNFGFSGAADIFVFISGYAASTAYAKIMLERGFIVGATRIFRRAWQLYAAYIVLFAIYSVSIAYVAGRYMAPDIIGEYYVTGLIDHPVWTLTHGVELQSKALNLDVLQLYTMLIVFFAPVLWMLLRWPSLALAGSLAGRAGHRPDPGPKAGRDARRERHRAQRWAWPGQRVRCAAAGRAAVGHGREGQRCAEAKRPVLPLAPRSCRR